MYLQSQWSDFSQLDMKSQLCSLVAPMHAHGQTWTSTNLLRMWTHMWWSHVHVQRVAWVMHWWNIRTAWTARWGTILSTTSSWGPGISPYVVGVGSKQSKQGSSSNETVYIDFMCPIYSHLTRTGKAYIHLFKMVVEKIVSKRMLQESNKCVKYLHDCAYWYT